MAPATHKLVAATLGEGETSGQFCLGERNARRKGRRSEIDPIAWLEGYRQRNAWNRFDHRRMGIHHVGKKRQARGLESHKATECTGHDDQGSEQYQKPVATMHGHPLSARGRCARDTYTQAGIGRCHSEGCCQRRVPPCPGFLR